MLKKIDREKLYVGLVLLFSLFLRVYNFFELSFFRDELSAITRTKYTSFSEVFSKGIIELDTHPPLIQVFLYFWTSIFGYSETAVKLPFLVVSIISLYFLYRVTKAFTQSISVSLVVTLFFACNQLHLTYSVQCRMYITGFLFALCLVLYWHLWLTTNLKKYFYLMILFAALGASNHHFNMMFAIIVWVTGLFWTSKEQTKQYVYALLLAILLYSPALYVAICQFTSGDSLTWMGPTEIKFIPKFFEYFFCYNPILYITAILGICLYFYRKKERSKWITVGFYWFIIVFFIGFMYSYFVSPMIQFHLLISVSPFLVIPIFSGFSRVLNDKKLLLLGVFVTIISIFSLSYSRQHFTLFPKQHYEELAKTVMSLNLDKERILVVSDVNFSYLAHYLKDDMAKIDTLSIANISTIDYKEILSKYTYIICASGIVRLKPYFTPHFIPTKKAYKGQLIEIEVLQKQSLLKKEQKIDIDTDDSLCYSRNLLLKEEMHWSMSYETPQIDAEGECFILLPKEKSCWFPSIKFLHDNKSSYSFEFEFKAKELSPNTKIMVSVKKGAESIFYSDIPLNKFFKSNGDTWTKASICLNKSSISMKYLGKPIEVEMMLFKEIGEHISIKNPIVKTYEENKYLYSIAEPIKQ